MLDEPPKFWTDLLHLLELSQQRFLEQQALLATLHAELKAAAERDQTKTTQLINLSEELKRSAERERIGTRLIADFTARLDSLTPLLEHCATASNAPSQPAPLPVSSTQSISRSEYLKVVQDLSSLRREVQDMKLLASRCLKLSEHESRNHHTGDD